MKILFVFIKIVFIFASQNCNNKILKRSKMLHQTTDRFITEKLSFSEYPLRDFFPDK